MFNQLKYSMASAETCDVGYLKNLMFYCQKSAKSYEFRNTEDIIRKPSG